MEPAEFASQVSGIATLAEPVRRDLYLYVAAQPEPVSRDQASAGVGVARHTAKFHLDRLVEDGLLDVDYKRLSGREGPGAGRPTKRYRRAAREVAVALPERHYDLAGRLMAQAIETSIRSGTDVGDALKRVAADEGAVIGAEARSGLPSRAGRDARLAATCGVLTRYGYEPRRSAHAIELANCPFHALAAEHTELVCGMNLALLEAAAGEVAGDDLTAGLAPTPEHCCVRLEITGSRQSREPAARGESPAARTA